MTRNLPAMPRIILPALLCLTALALGGCAATTTISGKVVEGPVAFVGVVDAADERLGGDGLPEATLVAMSAVDRGGYEVGRATSDKTGSFKLTIKDQRAILKPAEFIGEKPGYARASGVMSVPPPERRLLVMLKRIAPISSSPPR